MIMDLWARGYDRSNTAYLRSETRLRKLGCNENWLIKYLAKFSRLFQVNARHNAEAIVRTYAVAPYDTPHYTG